MLYLGLDIKCPQLDIHNVWFADDFDKNIADVFDEQVLPDDPSFYLYAPSRLDPSVAPEGKEGLYVLIPVPELSGGKVTWDETTLREFRRHILTRVGKALSIPALEEHIVFEKSFTPLDFQGTFNAYNGAAFGLKPTLMQSNYFRPHSKYDRCEGLYFAGASAHPGAGVPIVLTSAKLAVQELLRDDKGH